jgi:signal transduction histidine kinase
VSLPDELVALSATALVGADGAGRIVFANPAAEALLGLPAATLRGQPLSRLGIRTPPNESEWRATAELETEGSGAVPCLVLGRSLPAAAGGGMALALVDLRVPQERDRLAADLAAVRPLERVGRLAGGIAHDLKNVFQVLLGHGELIARKLPDDPKMRSSLEHMQRASERGTEWADAIMRLGRAAGPRRVERSLGDVVHAAVLHLRPTLPSGVALHAVVSEPAPRVVGDELGLRRIVEELTANALAAMRRGGVLTVTAEPRPQGGAVLEVRDTGSGMDAETLERVRRPHALAGMDSQHRGLGLAVVGRIAREHGGTLELSSEPEKGTTARVLFPKVPTPA